MLTQQETAEEAWTAVDVRQAIRQQADIARLAIDAFGPRVEAVIDRIDASTLRRAYLTGCGDSYYAALAAKLAMERWTGLPVEVLPSMEFSRYSAETAGADSLVVCLSNSGRVSRTIEAARVARSRGATVVAVTGRSESDLAASADIVLSQRVETPELPSGAGSLGLANYLVSLLGLYSLALELGTRNGRLDLARHELLDAALRAVPAAIEATYDAADEAAVAVAGTLVAEPVVYVLGAGPSLAAALFGCAKLYEQPQFEGVPQELEEFAHLQYFMVTEGTPVVFVAPPGSSRDRSIELFEAAQQRGGIVTAIGDLGDTEMAGAADHWLPLVGGDLPEELSPLISVVPLELLADSIAVAPGRPARRTRREVDPALEEAFEFRRIYGNRIVS
jgi:glucosamine--fructose-6-phosphate aminotransferase (isomerizing)